MIYNERQWTCDVVHCNAKEREEIGARTPQSTPAGWGLIAIAGVKKHLCPDHQRTLVDDQFQRSEHTAPERTPIDGF